MKTAIRVILGIAAGIGIIWSILGFIGVLTFGAVVYSVTEEDVEAVVEKTASNTLRMIGSFIMVIFGLITGIVSTGKEVRKGTGIFNGFLLFICGILATIWTSYVAGPLMILCGFLAVMVNAFSKKRTK